MSDQNGGEKRPNSSNKRGGRQGRSRNNNRSHRGGQNRKPKRYGGVSKAVLMERNAEQITAMEDKANRRFERKEPPMGFPDDLKEPNTHHFTWTTLPVPLKDEEALAKLVLRKGEFGWLDDERVDELAKIVEPHSMNLDQALSLRSALMQQKTVYGHGRLRSRAKEMLRLYKEGVSVVDLSQRFDGPPMNVFRLILAEMRWSKTKIKESLREPSRLSKREQKEFEAAEAADRVSNVDQGESQEKADLFEDVLADIITLDQFSRVIHRKTAKAFSNDAAAASLARRALSDDAFMKQAAPLERMFIEMPLMHSEDVADHESLLAMRGIDVSGIDVDGAHDDFAVKHYCVVRKFGRYPYRNKVLGRVNTPEEQVYLDSRPSTYGQ